jgi:carnitine O-palmitoyltransferase 2
MHSITNKKISLTTSLVRSLATHISVESIRDNDGKTDDKYQFLQKSPVPTDVFQRSLPRLPIPSLDKTCQRYLDSQRTLLDNEAFVRTEAIVKKFQCGEGVNLDAILRQNDKANKCTSYISDPWFDMYLKDRRPVAFTHNPGIALVDDPRPEFSRDTAMRAANLLISALRFHRSLKQNILYPDVFHMRPQKTANDNFWNRVRWMPGMIATPLAYLFQAFPLDMSQFSNLLQSTRIPMTNGRDAIQRFPADTRHVVILHMGAFYTFDVYDESGNIKDPAYYLASIRAILALPRSQKSGDIGALTSTDRDSWAAARQRLVDLGNEESLTAIDSALLVICLDDWQYHEEEQETVVKELCCGSKPENRWFDKSVSMIFSANGLVGINFEHSWGDGVAVMRFFDDILADNLKNAFVSADSSKHTDVHITELCFSLDESVKEAVAKAKQEHQERLDSVEFKAFRREGFGKNDCKKAKVGPDAVMQAAFQIAHLHLNGKFAPTYESCSTAIYRHGRTETVRPLTADMRTCAEAFFKQQCSDSEMLGLLQKCSQTHMEMTKNAAQGQGWDRHLFTLRQMSGGKGDLFSDPAYKAINHIILSTSTLSSANFGVGGFCPVVPNGYGLGYQIKENDLGVCTSVYRELTSSSEMASALEASFNSIAQVVQAAK